MCEGMYACMQSKELLGSGHRRSRTLWGRIRVRSGGLYPCGCDMVAELTHPIRPDLGPVRLVMLFAVAMALSVLGGDADWLPEG